MKKPKTTPKQDLPVSPYGDKVNFVPGEGAVPCDFFFLGEAPGKEEDEAKRPFVGPAGRVLSKMLGRFGGLHRSKIYITNAVKFRPPENRKPTMEEILSQREYLKKEIERVKPKLIVTLGKTALEALLAKELKEQGVGDYRNMNMSFNGIPFIVTYHPGVLLRESLFFPQMREDMLKIRDIVSKTPRQKPRGEMSENEKYPDTTVR